MAISTPGIGSGLDVKSIVSQLVALEKKPLQQLQQKATGLQSRLSAFGQLKSQIANLQDQAAKLANPANWRGMTFTSSNNVVLSGKAADNATAAKLTVEVLDLARAQSAASAAVPSSQAVGAGQLVIALGEWAGGTFTPATASSAVTVNVSETDDLAAVAGKINAANAGVSASVLNDATGARLVLTSATTGSSNGFRVQAQAPDGTPAPTGVGLGRLAYDESSGPAGLTLNQAGINARAAVNNVIITSATNTLENVVEGVNLELRQLSNGPVEVNVGQETVTARNNINNLVESFNSLVAALKEMTKYNPADKTAGTLQGDATAVGLQNALRRIFGSAGPAGNAFGRLSDLGVEFQEDGTLKVNNDKLARSLANPSEVERFFSTDAGNNGTSGLGVQVRRFAEGMLSSSGSLVTRNDALRNAIDRNQKDQLRLSERVERTEARLLAQYARLDGTLGKLTALNNYVAQQVTTWNNQKSG